MAKRNQVNEETLAKFILEWEKAISIYDRQGRLFVAYLVTLSFIGVSLVVYAVSNEAWKLLVPGTVMQCLIAWPLYKLVKWHEEKLLLRSLPALLQFMDHDRAQEKIADVCNQLVARLRRPESRSLPTSAEPQLDISNLDANT